MSSVSGGETRRYAHCGSQRIASVKNEKPQPYRCKDCRGFFSVKTGSVFHSAKLSLRVCLYAIYLLTVAKKSISSCQLARETASALGRDPLPLTDQSHLQSAIRSEVEPGIIIYTDGHGAYRGMSEYRHETVEHTAGEYVRGMAHTNGIESFWVLLKRGYYGTFHHFSVKHMARYVEEFAARQNQREQDTMTQINYALTHGKGKLGYTKLIF